MKGRQSRIGTVARLATLAVAALTSACTGMMNTKEDAIKLYVFDCGNILSRDVSMFSPGVDEGQSKQLTDSCYLIRHPKGDMIWDTGLSDQLTPEGVDAWDGAFHLSVSHPLQSQLKEIGVEPEEIEYLGISHFHGDHTGNANLFNKATLLIQQQEFDAAFGPDANKFGFNPDSYSNFGQPNSKILQGDYDVFGDGRVVIKQAVGHTPGHQVLFLDMPQSGPILLSGDLYHFTKNRTYRRVPSFNFNQEQSFQSIDKIEKFVKEKGAELWIQHDLEQNQKIKHAPEYYL
ncbi:N-acyl homoserine lactonase family protein [Hahella sp. CCB-MM4]|uniref:N-acyl homoserine lactonase family protein n=1 Tax=Hahella sp. (strain CCB-MM4) TaxID=1926491 RepID=UPI000B9C16F4|nr:N-acyl homoserine lactonase family protein [Hahella sp. CCB-MM4]